MTHYRYNFNAGPSSLPASVRTAVAEAVFDFRSTGIGIIETSHRSEGFEALLSDTKALLGKLLEVPPTHDIIFCTGGATQQFSMVPLNLLPEEGESSGAYILSGSWAEKAYTEGARLRRAAIAASSKSDGYRSIPRDLSLVPNASYLHYTSNNTIYGTQFHSLPQIDSKSQSEQPPLVCDASSDFCSRPIDVRAHALIYAGAQKNVGTAGITVVVAEKQLLAATPEKVPLLLQYGTYLQSDSLYNTPPTLSLLCLYEMLRWIYENGGLASMAARADSRAERLYQVLEAHPQFELYATTEDRSLMNVVFNLRTPDAVPGLLTEAEAAGFAGLAGHRSIGGLRVSLYNGVDAQAFEALLDFLVSWAKKQR